MVNDKSMCKNVYTSLKPCILIKISDRTSCSDVD